MQGTSPEKKGDGPPDSAAKTEAPGGNSASGEATLERLLSKRTLRVPTMEVDFTNANAEAGPSRLAGVAPRPSTATASAAAVPSRPESTRLGHSSHSQPAPATAIANTTTTRKDPVRRAAGPLIVPTQVTADGIRVVPQQFENCQLDDLITLIGAFLSLYVDSPEITADSALGVYSLDARPVDRTQRPDSTHDKLVDEVPLARAAQYHRQGLPPPNSQVHQRRAVLPLDSPSLCRQRSVLPRVARFTPATFETDPSAPLWTACARITSFTISSLTVHRFIIAAISVGSKALSDAFCTNGRYARVGGISVVEMNLLEKEFCEALDWRLTVSTLCGARGRKIATNLVMISPSADLGSGPRALLHFARPLAPQVSAFDSGSTLATTSRRPDLGPSTSAQFVLDLDATVPSRLETCRRSTTTLWPTNTE